MQLTASVKPSNAQQNVTWSASPVSVATITDTGLVTAIGLGQAVVTATTVGKPVATSTATVTVSATGTTNPVAGPYIRAMILTVPTSPAYPADLQSVDVCTDSSCSTPIPDAAVTIDGVALNYSPGKLKYIGNLTIAPSKTVVLKVSWGGNDYSTPVSQFSTFDTIVIPTPGTTLNAGVANTISWSPGAPTAGASHYVSVMDTSGKIVYPADGKPTEVPMGTNAYTIPAGSITTGGTYNLSVGIGTSGAYDHSGSGTPIPNAAPGSGVSVEGISAYRVFAFF